MKQSKVTERFLKYVKIPTASREESTSVPSTPCQFNLAHFLVEELHELGISNAFVDEKCYVYAKLPASEGCENAPAMGFISHMDTVSDFADHGVEPVITEDYDGQDFPLGESGRVLKVTDFPHLATLKGRTLITSDGTTILGADDKAGVAEIMTMVEEILEKDIPHGPISIGFTPDEEIGCGADYFDVPGFGADYAYTVDGGTEGSIEYENFNAAGAELTVHGFNVHPGDAKDIMINAALVLMEANAMLPAGETPRDTEGYEGFFHLTDMNGNVEKAHASYIVRDHDAQHFEKRLEQMQEIVKKLNERTGCKVTLHDYSDSEILRQSIADSAILVNGTSVGMAPKTDNTIITDTTMFHKDLFVFDVIYNPQETRLLREARAAGCKTSNGMYMRLYQGAASFELWTGQQMPVEIIKEKYFTK